MSLDKNIAKKAKKVFKNNKNNGIYLLETDACFIITSTEIVGSEVVLTDNVYMESASADALNTSWIDKNKNEAFNMTVDSNFATPASNKQINISNYTAQYKNSINSNFNIDIKSLIGVNLNNAEPDDALVFEFMSETDIPAGISLSSNGILSGRIDEIIERNLIIVCYINNDATVKRFFNLKLTFSKAEPTINIDWSYSVQPQEWTQNSPVNFDFASAASNMVIASDGQRVQFELDSSLPDGLSYNNGIISGSPLNSYSGSISFRPYIFANDGVTKIYETTYGTISFSFIIAAVYPFIGLTMVSPDSNLGDVKVGDTVQLTVGINPSNCTDNIGLSWDNNSSLFDISLSADNKTATVTFKATGTIDIGVTPIVNGETRYDSIIKWAANVTEETASKTGYRVSGSTDYPEINGDYFQDGEFNGKPKYVNTTSTATYISYMQCDSTLGWSIFYPGQPRSYTNDTTSAIPPTTGWNNGVTVTKIDDSSGDSSTSKHTLVVSGFRMTESMDYYNVSSLNGEYVIDDASKTGYDRTWTNPDNGVTILYRGTWGYWGFANSYNGGGGDIYTYGEDGNPYKADGSSAQWQDRGADSAGTATVKDGNSGSEGGESGSSNTFTVSGSPDTVFNGTYSSFTETSVTAYKHEANEVYLMYISSTLTWVFTSANPDIAVNEPPMWSYYAIDEGNNSPVGITTWYDAGGISVSGITVTKGGSEGDSDSDSGTSSADYIVSGASNSLADGEYYLTTETYAGFPVYKNANGYVIYMTGSYGWCISPAVGQAPTHGAQGNFDPVPPTTGWSGSVTVTKDGSGGGSGDGNGDSGEGEGVDNTSTSYLLVSGFSASNFGGDGTSKDPNGKYYLQDETTTGNNRVWISEDQNFKIYDSSKSGSWYIDSNIEGVYLGNSVYPMGAQSSPYYENDGSSYEWYSMGSFIDGASVTLVSGGSSDSGSDSGSEEEPSGVISYKVTCDGFTGDFTKYAGTYSQTNSPATGTDAVYKSENGCIMKYWNTTWGWTFASSETSSYPDIITYETSDNPVNATNKGSWWNEYNCVSIQPGKIELASSGSISNADYIVSGAGTEAANGDYVVYESSYTAYKHTTNDIYLWYDSNLVKWYICMTGPGTTKPAQIYYNTTVDCPDPTIAAWVSNIPVGSNPVPTVTKGGTASGSADKVSVDVNASYLSDSVGGYFFNGTYTIKDASATGQSAVYVNEANGTELAFNGSFWGLRPIDSSWSYILLYNYDAENPWDNLTASTWYDDYNLYSFPSGTVVKK